MFKSNGGFTLVELIVVIAILGLLAGIGVPAYSQYIGKAREGKNKAQGEINKSASQINEVVGEIGGDWENMTLDTFATEALN